jgi:hypothetical protein
VIRGLRVPVHLTSRDSLRIFHMADIWAARTGNDVRLVSANDHAHNRRSAHYQGLALDFHSSDPNGLAEMLRRAGYRVLWKVPGHYRHVHVEDNRARELARRALTVRERLRPVTSRARAARSRLRVAEVVPPVAGVNPVYRGN